MSMRHITEIYLQLNIDGKILSVVDSTRLGYENILSLFLSVREAQKLRAMQAISLDEWN